VIGKTIQEIADFLGCSVEEAERELQGLIDMGLVERVEATEESELKEESDD
jgi:predicted transcriptional regulator